LLLVGCGGPILANPLPSEAPIVRPSPAPTRTPDPQPVELPRDDGPHDRLTEWWYDTGHLVAADGRRFGFEMVIFRAERGRLPGRVVGRRPSAGRPLTEVVQAGFYGPGSEAWRLNREAMLLLGAGPRALLLQLAHPLVAEGVDEHSDFRADPWARLAATLRSYLRIVYGTAPQARAEIQRLNGLHRNIRGLVRDPAARERHGSRYRARDPELSLWVHATLVDSTIAAYDAWIEPLSPERRARYYDETLSVGAAFRYPGRTPPKGCRRVRRLRRVDARA